MMVPEASHGILTSGAFYQYHAGFMARGMAYVTPVAFVGTALDRKWFCARRAANYR